MAPQSPNEIEVNIRQNIANDLHEVFQRLRTLAARAKETGSFGSDRDRQALLSLMEGELKAIIRETKRIVVPFLIDDSQKIESDAYLLFIQDLDKLSSRYESQSREIILHYSTETVRRLAPVQYISIHKIIELCLGNAAEHAKASRVELFLQRDQSQPDKWVELLIKYDGNGDSRLNDLDAFAEQIYPQHKGLFRLCQERDKLSSESQVSSRDDCTVFAFKIPI